MAPKLRFPKIKRLVLENISLFTAQRTITIDLPDGVLCLAGANGLGKSTFLALVNFALTGIVAEPGRKFESVQEYLKDCNSFTADFFDGRVEEEDREVAQITLEMLVGSKGYRLTRAVFAPAELRSLTIIDRSSTPEHVTVDGSSGTPPGLQGLYEQHIAADVGLQSFDQFAFLQHFMLTFDERRHLLFWDSKVLSALMHLAFGIDYAEATRAENLRRESERAESLGRNYKWQATELRKRIKDMEAQLKSAPADDHLPEEVVEQHKALTHHRDEADTLLERLDRTTQDVTARLAEVAAAQGALRAEYADEFARRMENRSPVTAHPLVVSSIKSKVCALCGSKGKSVADSIEGRSKGAECPLCASATEAPARPRDIKRLREIDEQLVKNRHQQDQLLAKFQRVSEEQRAARSSLQLIEKELADFEVANEATLRDLGSDHKGADTASSMLKSYRKQMEELLTKSKDQYSKRDEKNKELKRIDTALARQYSAVESTFVPIFADLAHEFLGLDLNVRFETKKQAGVNLVLEVRSTERRRHHQLSESQRFFLDIALRMAFADFMSGENAKAALLIDTPEGSLDIAYEKRAGDMLAKYVKRGHQLLMTANINTSQLLHALAQACGPKLMTICPMTTWTELSEVQIAEEKLFEQAFATIEQALAQAETP